MQTNSLRTSIIEDPLQGKAHQEQNSHDGKLLATTTLNMPYVLKSGCASTSFRPCLTAFVKAYGLLTC